MSKSSRIVSLSTAFVATVFLGGIAMDARTFAQYVEEQKLSASDASSLDHFGYTVSVTGNTVVVGAFIDDCMAQGDCGLAYVLNCPNHVIPVVTAGNDLSRIEFDIINRVVISFVGDAADRHTAAIDSSDIYVTFVTVDPTPSLSFVTVVDDECHGNGFSNECQIIKDDGKGGAVLLCFTKQVMSRRNAGVWY